MRRTTLVALGVLIALIAAACGDDEAPPSTAADTAALAQAQADAAAAQAEADAAASEASGSAAAAEAERPSGCHGGGRGGHRPRGRRPARG